jgi:hypothetical protein
VKQLPETEEALVLRTDFSDQRAWEAIRATVQRPFGIFRGNVRFVDDREYADLTKEQLLALIPDDSGPTFIFVADRTALSNADHPLLVVDLFPDAQRGREFRTIPSQVGAIENNLSIGNMDFEEFADAVDEAGIFRGFRKM